MHQLLPVFELLLHLHYLHQLAHVDVLLDDFLMLPSRFCFICLQFALRFCFYSWVHTLQNLGLYRYLLVVQVGKPVQAQLMQMPQPIHARWNINYEVVVQQEDLQARKVAHLGMDLLDLVVI